MAGVYNALFGKKQKNPLIMNSQENIADTFEESVKKGKKIFNNLAPKFITTDMKVPLLKNYINSTGKGRKSRGKKRTQKRRR